MGLKYFLRAADLSERKKHIPLVDRTPEVPPPLFVAIAGPPKVKFYNSCNMHIILHFIIHKHRLLSIFTLIYNQRP